MPQCAFKSCAINHRNAKILDGISFFNFPSNPFRCAEWVSIVAKERGEEIYKPCKNSKICSIHFDKSDITGNLERRRLLKTAVPKLQIHAAIEMHSPICKKKKMDLSSQSISPTTGTFEDVKIKQEMPLADEVSVNSPAASLSDLKPICDNPKEEYLKKKLTKCRRVIINKSKKIKNLQQVNKRLTMKNLSLKNTIDLLQKKQSIYDQYLNIFPEGEHFILS